MKLDRRMFLRGAGVALALPMLDAMLPLRSARAATAKAPKLLYIFFPNGYVTDDGAKPPTYMLDRLKAHNANLSVVSGLENVLRLQVDARGNAHACNFIPFLSGVSASEANVMGRTFDREIAALPQHRGSVLDSVSVNAFYQTGSFSHDPVLLNHPSWDGPNKPRPVYHNPRDLFVALFGGVTGGTLGQTNAAEIERLKRKRLLLDGVMSEIKSLDARLGKSDRVRLDEYLTSIAELDKRTQAQLDSSPMTTCSVGSAPKSFPQPTASQSDTYPERLGLLQDIIVTAFQCDATRVCTFLHAPPGGAGIRHTFINGMEGSVTGWHGHSHYTTPNYQGNSSDLEVNKRNFRRITSWHFDRIADAITKLASTKQANGKSVLDETLVVFGSCQHGGGNHGYRDLFLGLAGQGDGLFKSGVKLHHDKNVPLCNAWLTVLQAFGVNKSSWGNSSGTVNAIRV
ncbi:MAG: DUF1552 domain-containing protein [Myxococcales bacterium]|nr:DUF1552 domain-containing protein [Myxococcales bacterium]